MVVEDEAMVAMLLEDALAAMGCRLAATAGRLEEALARARDVDLDFAVLDINLNGKLSYPVADLLVERGVPFLFCTGYGLAALPQRFQGVPAIGKPFHQRELEQAVASALRARR